MGFAAALSAWGSLATVASADVVGISVAAQPGEGVVQLARVRMPGVPIPANGAILIEGVGSNLPELEVLDRDGSPIPGTHRSVGEVVDGRTLYAWLPEHPLQPGPVSVTLFDPFDSSLAQLEELQVIEAIDDALPEIMSAPSASELTGNYERVCCQVPVANLARECAIIRQTTVIQVDGGLWSSDPATKLNQYLFRYSPHTGIGTASIRPRPLETLAPIRFVNAADEYCFELTALNVATLEERVYRDLPSCAARGELSLGTVDVEPQAAFFSPQSCPFPLPEFEAQWCEINQDVCEAGMTDHCEQYAYICDDGPRPERWSVPDAGTMPRIDLPPRSDASDATASELDDSGCSATALGSKRPRGSLAWLMLAIGGLWRLYVPRAGAQV